MSIKVKISQPGDGMKLIEAVRRAFGITIRKVHMEVNGKSVDLDLRKKTKGPMDQTYRGGRP